MDVSDVLEHCLSKPGAWPDNPWDHEVPVIKVGPPEQGKIFAFPGPDSIGVKAGVGRDVADEWLQRYPDDVTVMAYIGRQGWNTMSLAGAIPDDELLEAVDESYRLVVSKMPKKHRPVGWDAV